MLLFNLFLSLLISIIPPSKYTCGGTELNATIYNGLHDRKEIVKDLENLEEDSFIFLEWRDYEIKIPISSYASLDFANRFWRWSYGDKEKITLTEPTLSRQYPTGKIITYKCTA